MQADEAVLAVGESVLAVGYGTRRYEAVHGMAALTVAALIMGPLRPTAILATAIHATAMLITAAWVDDDGLCGDGQEEHGEELEHDLDAKEGECEERGEGLVRLALLHAHLRRVQLRAVREVLVGVVQVGGTRVGRRCGCGCG